MEMSNIFTVKKTEVDATTNHEEKVSLLTEEDKKVYRICVLINLLVIGLVIVGTIILFKVFRV